MNTPIFFSKRQIVKLTMLFFCLITPVFLSTMQIVKLSKHSRFCKQGFQKEKFKVKIYNANFSYLKVKSERHKLISARKYVSKNGCEWHSNSPPTRDVLRMYSLLGAGMSSNPIRSHLLTCTELI